MKNQDQITNPALSYRKLLRAVIFLLVIGFALYLFRRNHSTWHADEGVVFGTMYHVEYLSSSDLHEELLAELNKVDATLSLFNKESLLSHLNDNKTTETDTMFREVFALAQKVSKETHGAFDFTVAPLVKLWGFGPRSVLGTPSDSLIERVKTYVGYDKVSIVNNHIDKTVPQVQMDFGAIAKGYAVDCLARLLEANGVSDFMIEIGGEVVTHGQNPDGKPWTVGIVRPVPDEAMAGELQAVLTFEEGALATSGNYLNYYKQGGKTIAHTIDPRTGQPIQREVLSATVIAPDCATADAYATAFMVLGLDSAKHIVAQHPEIEAYLIFADSQGKHQVWQTPRVEQMLKK